MNAPLIIDTNAYSDFMRGKAWIQPFTTAPELLLPLPVIAELRAGFRRGTKNQENERTLLIFISRPRTRVVSPNDTTTHHYASLETQLRKQGTSIPTNDVWIASLAIQFGAWLCTSDKHFDHLPQIPRISVS